jgi:ATP-dependent DNA ligase
MEIIIDGIGYGNLEIERYWSLPKSKDPKIEIPNLVFGLEYIAARKIDGQFLMIIKDNNGNFYARPRNKGVNGEYPNKIDWMPQIKSALQNIPNGTVLIGELYVPHHEGSKNVTKIAGCLLDKSLKRQEDEDWRLHFYCFDCLAFNGHNIMNKSLEERLQYMRDLELNQYLKWSGYIHEAIYYEGQELWDYIGEVLAEGGEGVVLQKRDSHYAPGKRTAWKSCKVKKEIEHTVDCFLTGNFKKSTKSYQGLQNLEEWPYWQHLRTGEKMKGYYYQDFKCGATIEPISKGYFYNFAGSIEIALYDEDKNKIIPCGWISNITEEVRKGIVENPELWKKKVVEISAMDIDEDSKKFRHGKIINWRQPEDKKWYECSLSQIL